jgi:hypothetical protein
MMVGMLAHGRGMLIEKLQPRRYEKRSEIWPESGVECEPECDAVSIERKAGGGWLRIGFIGRGSWSRKEIRRQPGHPISKCNETAAFYVSRNQRRDDISALPCGATSTDASVCPPKSHTSVLPICDRDFGERNDTGLNLTCTYRGPRISVHPRISSLVGAFIE